MASKYLQKYQVPEGFYDILHEFTREVLRAQPEDIIEYAANYFEHKAQGKEYYYESKYNIQRDKYDQDNSKKYNPTPNQDYAEQAKRVVQASNQRVQVQSQQSGHKSPAHQHSNSQQHQGQQTQEAASHHPQRQPSGNNAGRPQTQNSITSDKPNDTSKLSHKSKKSDQSHPEEKKISKEFVGDLYNSALHKALKPTHQEEAYEGQEEDGEGQEEQQQNYADEGEGQEEGEYYQGQQYEGGEEGEYVQQEGEEYEQQEGGEYEQQEGGYEQEEAGEVQYEQQVETEQQQQEQEVQQSQPEQVVLDGPVEEYENVALKIQSVYRGKKSRQEQKQNQQ
ncbi:regulatory subunit of type II PKA R-subunit family protein (macronuclear) [Tetrahymena thermophila SB210]|uniref:Regulatory subunit of type II PKA R-subunit family protein n=1 Tax=Tetrahymena thermophila (strain SB210) TaxID=312017 RepID=I7MMP3_TETTS|nr:regulatory subunit of type II PKA R-subunit family protein [Tetrahymena thermophila SB210]EAS06137.1 regulatory subunit of type II PKA R-subunit family protein [Tetrahymena thermophila SB210]|eukprot:XP_001026382.1 regulatory subunit of type II PKA R-subunit family protein [Tetrahymena thermophila SB210]